MSQQKGNYAKKIFRSSSVVLNGTHILVDGLYDSVPLLLSFMALSFDAGEKDAGLIVSLAALLGTPAGLSTTFFSEKLGFLRVLSAIILLYAVGFVANAFSPHIYFSGIFFIVAMAGQGVFHNIAFAHLATHTKRSSLGKVMGDFTAIGDIGRIPIASFAGFAAAWTLSGIPGWRFVCLLYGLAGLSCAAYLFRMARGTRREVPPAAPMTGVSPAPSDDEAALRFPAFALLRERHISLSVAANALDAFSGDQIFMFLPFLLVAKGFDPTVIGGFALAFTVGCLAGKMACGRMVGLFGSRKVFVAAKLCMAALLAVMAMGQTLSMILGASLALGIVTKGTVPVVQTILVEGTRRTRGYEGIFSINNFFRGMTNIITPLFFGCFSSAFSVECCYILMAAISITAVFPVFLMGRGGHAV